MKKFILLTLSILIAFNFFSCSIYQGSGTKVDVPKEERELLKDMQSDIYKVMKEGIYDKLNGKMSYSSVQTSMDNAERQIKTKISTFNISLDLSDGTMSPKWICSVKLNSGNRYPLMYISVDLNSTYYVKHKHIGTYTIS